MSGSRGEAAGAGGGIQFSVSASAPPSNSSSIAPSSSPMMTRLAQSSEHSNSSRTSNGMQNEGRSIADLLNSTSPLRTSMESGVRKRKLSDAGEDLASRRKRIAEHKAVRLKRIKKEYVEHVSEMLTLEGCSLPDVYRKRPSAPALISYLKNNRLDPTDEAEDLSGFVTPVTTLTPQPEAKVVMGVGASPTSLASASTPKPTQQASPLLESETTPAPLSSLEKRLLSPLKSSPATTQPSTSTSVSVATPSNNRAATPQRLSQSPYDSSLNCSQEQIVERAKQEAQVMARIGELQKEGLWAEKRLPKVQEPPRTKAHWDYLLEEMVWLAADFAQERKWKKAAAKKCAKMVQKYFQDKELMAQKAVRSQELQLKRVANIMAKEIKQFWANAEKLVEFKHQTMLEEKRKKAMDQHLSFIVDQTEKYSSLVAEGLNKTGGGEALSTSQSVVSSRAPSPSPTTVAVVEHHTSDVEFEPGGTSSDDEETIAKAEAEDEKEGGMDNANEIELLTKESELPLEDLLKDYLDNREKIVLEEETDENEASSVDKDEEFRASDKDSSDDEETIQEQEKAEGKVDHKQELDDLKTEGEMSIDELRAKYGAAQTNGTPMETESQESESEEEEDDEEEEEGEGDSGSSSEEEAMEVEEETSAEDLSQLLTQEVPTPSEDANTSQQVDKKESEIHDVAAIAESLQPKGNTLSSTSVVTKVPFLLKHSLREYQHIGLDWLVTMHDRKLNGILADEMGLGKTIQTIAVLAHLACEKGNWGPHLIVVPTSVMLNWEMEFKKWCPAFKILTYYGTQKERKLKRTGWSKPNAFHICITSYKLVIQDYQSFRRKSWKYLILDEAQNIKNFKSQRWQLLLNFQTQRRLLLTGTPLQNNLMELWSLMHFLMPTVFQSHREFKEWFSNPVTGMIEGNSEYNEQIIKRLHKVLRPFLLRRLKCEVEKQLPKKYEHVVMCRLSNRQRYLYDDFMSRAKTKETLATGNLLSVINVLMQLRKVCNHPNLFEVRPTVSPFQMEAIELFTASCVWSALDYDPFKHVNLQYLNLDKVSLELWMSAWMAHRSRKFRTPSKLIEELDSTPPSPPKCPPGRIKVHVRFSSQANSQAQISLRPGAFLGAPGARPGVNPTLGPRVGPSTLVRTAITNQVMAQGLTLRVPRQPGQLQGYSVQLVQQRPGSPVKVALGAQSQRLTVATGFAQLVQTSAGRHHLLFTSSPHLTTPGTSSAVVTSAGGQRLLLGSVPGGTLTRLSTPSSPPRPVVRVPTAAASATVTSPLAINHTVTTAASSILVTSTISSTTPTPSPSPSAPPSPSSVSVAMTTRASTSHARRRQDEETTSNIFVIPRLEEKRRKWREEKLKRIAAVNEQRCTADPLYGWDLVKALRLVDLPDVSPCNTAHSDNPSLYWHQTEALSQAILSVDDRLSQLNDLITRFVVFVPAVKAPRPRFHVSHPPPWKLWQDQRREAVLEAQLSPRAACLHPIVAAMMTLFPDPSLIQYDCGKLQSLDRLLRRLKTEGHRVLIFTQMTRMLDVLEAFLNFHGHIYLRLDGTTKVDQRQVLMERFNGDKRIFCFILSTRSGGVGVNLTGADTVIFYDSDWNPTMDAQAQDRCHRIGQTRDVHIYRLVSEKTVEENILKKANQKRLLGDLAIEGGNFTTAYFKSSTIQDLFNVDVSENDASKRMAEVLEREAERKAQLNSEDTQQSGASSSEEKAALGVLETAMAAAEDETDVAAAKTAKAEAVADLAEFDESIPFSHMDNGGEEEVSKAEQEVNALVEQLSGIERYAMKFIEETEAAFSSEQLAAAEAEIEQQKREWEEERLAALRMQEEEEERNAADASEELLTYSREDAQNQIWLSQNGRDQMPMWCPPTPPVDDSDVYIDYTMCFLYEPTTMSEAQLPPVYAKKDRKRSRVESTSEGRGPIKAARHQREELSLMHAPRSLFDRPSPALVKMRHDLRLHKYRGGARPSYSLPPAGPLVPRQPVPAKPEPDLGPEWMIYEDWAILQAVQNIQELTLNLVVVCPGHTPNWEMVADMVNMISHIYRSPRQCKNRYESVIIPREEGKMIMDMSSKKPKKTKGIYKLPQTKCSRPMKTSQMYMQDSNMSYTQVMNAKFESIRSISNKRTPTMKPVPNNKPDMKNPKHAEVLSGCGIDYDNPMSPVDVATRRADRINKEKQLQAQHVAQQAQQQLALLRNQMGVPAIGSTAINKTIIAASPSQSPTPAKPFVQAPLSVQELVVAGGGQVVARASTPSPAVGSPQRAATVTQAGVAQATTTVAAKVVPSKQLSPAQLQLYQKQALLRQQQLRAAALQGRAVAAAAAAGAVPVTAPSQPRIHQVKQVGAVGTGAVTRVTDSEVAALIKRQAVAAGAVGAKATLTPAQILAQAGLQAQGGGVAALVKTASGQHLPLTLPQVKAALPAGVKTATATPQQIRQLTLQNQLLAQQRSKLAAGQKVGLGPVMVTNKGVPAQLIVQSQKSVPTTMTMQQIQQVIKHVHPQHLAHVTAAGGQTVVSQGSSGQVISTVITKNQAGTSQTRVIPQQSVKQTIQVVTAAPGGVRTSVPNVTIDRSNIKVTGSVAQQQALLNQVTAVLQQGQQIAVRQAPVRIQTTGSNVTVSQAPTLLTLSHPQPDNTQNQ